MSQLRETSHVMHAILTILFVPWLIVWICCYLSDNQYNQRVMLEAQLNNKKD